MELLRDNQRKTAKLLALETMEMHMNQTLADHDKEVHSLVQDIEMLKLELKLRQQEISYLEGVVSSYKDFEKVRLTSAGQA